MNSKQAYPIAAARVRNSFPAEVTSSAMFTFGSEIIFQMHYAMKNRRWISRIDFEVMDLTEKVKKCC